MSKYQPLWEYVQGTGENTVKLSFEEAACISGTAIDHSFLTYKKELLAFGYEVRKISLKEQTILFQKR